MERFVRWLVFPGSVYASCLFGVLMMGVAAGYFMGPKLAACMFLTIGMWQSLDYAARTANAAHKDAKTFWLSDD